MSLQGGPKKQQITPIETIVPNVLQKKERRAEKRQKEKRPEEEHLRMKMKGVLFIHSASSDRF